MQIMFPSPQAKVSHLLWARRQTPPQAQIMLSHLLQGPCRDRPSSLRRSCSQGWNLWLLLHAEELTGVLGGELENEQALIGSVV